jgi:hypothetical protein
MFGRSPIFVFDPNDSSNAPVPGLHDAVITNWPLHPAFVQKLFVQTFTGGLAEPRTRVRESVWRSALARLADSVSQCALWQGEPVRRAAVSATVLGVWAPSRGSAAAPVRSLGRRPHRDHACSATTGTATTTTRRRGRGDPPPDATRHVGHPQHVRRALAGGPPRRR